jgi:hypothetical protein
VRRLTLSEMESAEGEGTSPDRNARLLFPAPSLFASKGKMVTLEHQVAMLDYSILHIRLLI